jgi:hypothetical protein
MAFEALWCSVAAAALFLAPAATNAESGWPDIEGRVVHIDAQNRIIQIRERKTDMLVQVDVRPNAQLSAGTSRIHSVTLAELREGEHVQIHQ